MTKKEVASMSFVGKILVSGIVMAILLSPLTQGWGS
jgi:hypothetical protein